MAQTSYDLYMEKAHIGMLADSRPRTIETSIAEGAILFGYGVTAATDPSKVKLPAGDTEIFRGVAVSTWATEQNAAGDGEYTAKESVNVLRKGVIWVPVVVNVVADDVAYCMYAVSEGQFSNVVTNAITLPVGVFRSSANVGELAILEINLPS